MAWDRTSPATNSALASAPVRGNIQALDEAIGSQNLYTDPKYLIWPGGDAVAPAGTSVTGTGGSIARSTTTFKAGGMAPQLTMGSANTRLVKALLASLDASLRGMSISVGCYVNTVTASLAAIEIDDGVGQTLSSFHSGGSGWEWLTATRVLDAAATKLEVNCYLDIGASAGNAFFDEMTVLLGPIPPQFPKPCPHAKGTLYIPRGGVQAVATNVFRFLGAEPFRVENTSLRADTAPTGAALIADVNHWDGAAYQSMYATRPQIAAAASAGGADPDGTYRYRCFEKSRNTDGDTDRLLNVDIDQIGSTVEGEDLEIYITVLQYHNLLADLGA